MKILIDSSTLYSAIAFPRKENEMVKLLLERYTIVVTDYIRKELERNFKETFSEEKILFELKMFLSECETKTKEEYRTHLERAKKKISEKDAPILACSMLKDIDYLIASDKEFHEIECEEANILSPQDARETLL